MKGMGKKAGMLLTVLACTGLAAVAGKVPKELPDPDGEPADQTKPVKVYILLGQSNMVGFGQVGPAEKKGTLEHVTKIRGAFPHLVDDQGKWTVRKDVWCVQVTAGSRKDWLQPGFGARAKFIGPELGFGHVMGYAHNAPVLIIKSTMGNRALGWDLMPPSSRTIKPEDHPNKWYQGWQYDIFMKDIHRVLDNLPRYFPAYKNQGYEIAGFVWWQGHKDQSTPRQVKNDNWAKSYEKNLVNLIGDLRKEFKAPKAKFVLATIAFGGERLSGSGLTIAKAQLAVDGDSGKYPQFKGNVKTIDARPYWRDKEVSPSGAGYHYNHNAETCMLVGDALGRAMAELMDVQVRADAAAAREAERAGKLGRAYALHRAVAVSGAEGPLRDHATERAKAIAKQAEDQLAKAAACAARKLYAQAIQLLTPVASRYEGCEFGTKARTELERLKSDPSIRAVIAQAQLDAKADALAQVLHGKEAVSVAEAMEGVLALGYTSRSKDFRFLVNQTLRKGDRFKRVARGVYALKA